MTVIAPEARAAFREQGFVVIPDVLSEAALARGRSIVASMLEKVPPAQGQVGP